MAGPVAEKTVDNMEERREKPKLPSMTNAVSESSAQSVASSLGKLAEETQPASSPAHPPESRTDNMTDNISQPSAITSTENAKETKAMTLREMVSVVFGPAPMPTGDSEKELWSDSVAEPAAEPTAQTTTTENTEGSSTAALRLFTDPAIYFSAKTAGERQNQSESSENDLFQLEGVMDGDRNGEFYEEEMSFLNAFNVGVRSPTEQAAVEAARKLDSLCPSPKEEEECNNWLWRMWCMMLSIARNPNVTVAIQERLICIMLALREIAKGELRGWSRYGRLWTDLPELGFAMETFFNNPTMAYSTFDPISVQTWEKETYFGARLMVSGIYGDYMEAIFNLRIALEEKRDTGPLVAACRIRGACIWLTHAGKCFLRYALENAKRDGVPEDQRPAWQRGGSLYHGPGTMCLQRWGFWIERLENLEPIIDEETRKVALYTANTMREVEKRMGNLLSS